MLQLIRTDYIRRYHVYIDSMAAKFDTIRLELLEQTALFVNKPLETLWPQVQASMAEMRYTYDQHPVYHGLVFSPFARIIVLDGARESAETSLQVGMIVGEGHPDHEERVRGLARALDAFEHLQSQPAARRAVN